MTGAAILIGFGADLVFGDPRRGHPVALFGALALRVERLEGGPLIGHQCPMRPKSAVIAARPLTGEARRTSCRSDQSFLLRRVLVNTLIALHTQGAHWATSPVSWPNEVSNSRN